MPNKTVTTKIWSKTHKLTKIIASVLDMSMLEVFHQAILDYAQEQQITTIAETLLMKQISKNKKGEIHEKNPGREGQHGDDEALTRRQ